MPEPFAPLWYGLWYGLIPFPPLVAALWIGLDMALRVDRGESGERPTARIALGAAALSLGAVLAADALALVAGPPGQVRLGTWPSSGPVTIPLSLTLDGLGLLMANLVAAICLATLRFSVHYMHREPGFRRFFMVLSLFTGAMLLIVTAGNAVLTFVGWELAGVGSYLLIGFVQERPRASENATRAFVTNRIGDTGFLLAIVLCFAWLGGVEWPDLLARSQGLGSLAAGLILLGFLLAALAKSALLPFSAWISRALEGPTPSSAVFYGSLMVHVGFYLLIRTAPLFDQAPALLPLVAGIGLATGLYGWLSVLTQADVKSGLIDSTTTQVGLMVLWCGLGWPGLATLHLVLHALWRAYQFLQAPALMHWMDAPVSPVGGWLARRRLLYTAALQRFWLDPASDWLLVRPTRRLAADVRAFDEQVIKRLVGLPGEGDLPATVAGQDAPARRGPDPSRARGLLGGLMTWLADRLHVFEDRLILNGGGRDLEGLIRGIGEVLTRVDDLLGRPRYLLLLIMATLVVILLGGMQDSAGSIRPRARTGADAGAPGHPDRGFSGACPAPAPAVGGGALAAGHRARSACHRTGPVATAAELVLGVFLYVRLDHGSAALQFAERWMPLAPLNYHAGVDEVSVLFILLTGLVCLLMVAYAPRRIRSSPPELGGTANGAGSCRSCAGSRRPGGHCAPGAGWSRRRYRGTLT